jgi:hypothetical protein
VLTQREGAVPTVGGEVSEVGGKMLLVARIVDPVSGEDIASVRETAVGYSGEGRCRSRARRSAEPSLTP